MIIAIVLLYIIVICLIIFAIAAWQEIREIVRVSKKTQKELKLKNMKEIEELQENNDLLSLQYFWDSMAILKLKEKIKKLDASVEKFSTMAITASNHAAFVNTFWKNEERKARHAKKESQVIDDANEIRQKSVSKQ